MSSDFDIAVVGSGFAGSLFALLARSVGRSVVLIEKGTHPRFAIGESSSPLANLLLEELCDRYDLPRLKPLAAWGTWQRTYPEIGCGLKRGFTFYGHRPGYRFAADRGRRDQLLVAASPRDEVADTHWYRADFDHFLVREAQAAGVEYLDQTNLESFLALSNGAALEGSRRGKRVSFKVRFVVDASGPRGFLHRALGLVEGVFRGFPPTQGLYTHFEGVERLDEMGIFVSPEHPPYPVDDAAVHHVLENGWIWVLRFGNGIVSAGVAAAPRLATEIGLSDGAAAWERLLSLYPTVEEQFARARPVRPFVHSALLPFRSGAAAGPNWALLPSAAAFVDPLLSTGIPLALLGIQRLAEAVERDWNRPSFGQALENCAASALSDADAAALLIAALYAAFSDFELFGTLCLLYFAAASFTEAAHRLGRPELAGSFLLRSHPVFGRALQSCCEQVLESRGRGGLTRLERSRLMAKIYLAIEPLDVAGLGKMDRRNWHPVEAGPLMDAAQKLGATGEEIQRMLERSGFFPEAA